MKPTQAKEALKVLIAARQPAHMWGGPGIGKSDIVRALARELGRQLIDVRAVLLDPVDLRGLPHVNGDSRAHWCIPDFLPREGSGILFLDELNRAPMLVQNACLQLVLDRKIGEYTLPENWDILAAGNRLSDGGGVTKMNSALSTRFRHLDIEPDLEDWCHWAIKANVEPVVIAFVRFRPELLYKFDATERTFPCPRTLESLSKILASSPSPAIENELFDGTIGKGASVEFAAFMRLYRNLPSIDAILLNPKDAPVPKDDPASLFAVSCALGRRATVENLGRVIQYLDRLSDEYNVLAIKDAVAREQAITSTKEFCQWAIKHSDVVF
jgi:ATPase family associated with various cellular activities (AAA)